MRVTPSEPDEIVDPEATDDELESWENEDYWRRMDFNPMWIFAAPAVVLFGVLGSVLLVSNLL